MLQGIVPQVVGGHQFDRFPAVRGRQGAVRVTLTAQLLRKQAITVIRQSVRVVFIFSL